MTPLPPKHGESLSTRSIPDCTVLPYQRAGRLLRLGAFDSQGNCIPESLLYRNYAQIGYPGDFVKAPAVRDHTAIYAGQLVPHYGHFLLENLSRLWFAKARPEVPIVWACQASDNPQAGTGYAAYQAEILSILGIINPPIFLTSPVLFKQLIIPDVGFVFNDVFHPVHADFLGAYNGNRRPGLKVWLSRSALGDRATNLLEPTIELRLAEAGWTIIRPEKLSVSKQLAYLSAAERVAGDEGSALHTLVLLRDTIDLKVDIFYRRAPHHNRVYDTIAERKGFSQTFHACTDEVVIRRRLPHVRKISYNASQYLDKLDVPVAAPAAGQGSEPVKPSRGLSARRINRLAKANDAQSYLEIGAADGKTFHNVGIDRRHAVDPHFRFDPRAFEAEHTRFFEMAPQEFFLHCADRNTKYDVILVGGLHSFEQTFRTFCATQSHCHDDTIWIIDDVLPSNIFSSLPNRREAVKQRQLHEVRGGGWQGDVFKLIFAIHDFFPSFCYRTVARDNPQTVLVRRPRSSFEPLWDSFERISRMTYFDFCAHQAILELTAEEDVLKWVRGVFRQDRRRPGLTGTANNRSPCRTSEA